MVIKNFSLNVDSAESIALVGPPGSGKILLIDLICGLRSPKSGHIEIDGIDVREVRPDSLREQIAVCRSTEIFRGKIDENVHLNRAELTANHVREALASVGLLDQILGFPDGLSTELQPGGAPLSASQATRLMIARAIVGRPRLLLIDGILDGLAEECAKNLLANLTGDSSPWTLLVATGKQEVIAGCDRVVSLGFASSQGRPDAEQAV